MSDVTRIIESIRQGDRAAADELLPIVYNELRRLAASRLSHERPGQTLGATALVHEAYLRLVDVVDPQRWEGRGHFFAAAAEAMRRILVERARAKASLKRGGALHRIDLDSLDLAAGASADQTLELDDLLTRLSEGDAEAGELVKLRYFGGLSVEQAAETIGMSRATAYRHWTYARAWLRAQMNGEAAAG